MSVILSMIINKVGHSVRNLLVINASKHTIFATLNFETVLRNSTFDETKCVAKI